ncbi:prisilkin-39-like [Ostrea edulis]|uniref:prisilkin-39-like n=1 Tax=Ostrea edulis TaxID=37623 RepID=UPI0024AF5E12|nr:prisilkin-39-like [Ostrea edulis]
MKAAVTLALFICTLALCHGLGYYHGYRGLNYGYGNYGYGGYGYGVPNYGYGRYGGYLPHYPHHSFYRRTYYNPIHGLHTHGSTHDYDHPVY